MFEYIDTRENNGEFNMQFDLDLVNRFKKSKTDYIRVYQWKPYAISLGYNQKNIEVSEDKCDLAGIDIVRRPTGGRAVFHAEELTYSVVMEGTGKSISEIYRFISEKLVNAFVEYDCELERCLSFEKSRINFPEHYKEKTSFACFSASALNEIKADGKKLVGSAQRKFSDVILQHGSILLNKKHKEIINLLKDDRLKRKVKKVLDDQTISFEELMGKKVDLARLKECIKKEFSKNA
jgi:lipoate-protein ligase A